MAGNITPRRLLAQFDWPQDSSGVPVTDTGWFNSQIYDQLLMARAAYAASVLDKDPAHISKDMQQTIGCIRLTEASVEECPCEPPSGCTWFKTEVIPQTINGYISVTGIGGNLGKLNHYTYRDWTMFKYSLNSRIPAERIRGYYAIRNNRIYLLQESHVESVALSAIFYDPVETQRFRGCGTEPESCMPFLDYDFYISPQSEQAILNAAFALITGMKQRQPFDDTNNAEPPLGLEPIKQ